VFWGGVSLLSTYKQIHSEAAGIAYPQDTFAVTQGDSTDLESRIRWASGWLESMGQEATLVKSVHIDVAGLYDTGSKIFDVLPILQHLWTHAHVGLVIAFIATDLQSCRVPVDTEKVNIVLPLLAADYTLEIKRLAKFPRLLHEVSLASDGLSGDFTLRDTDPSPFDIHNGRIESRSTMGRAASQQQAFNSRKIFDLIVQDLIPRYQEYIYNITKKTVSPALSRTLWVDQNFQKQCACIMLDNRFQVVVETTELRTNLRVTWRHWRTRACRNLAGTYQIGVRAIREGSFYDFMSKSPRN
jgi:hypothetical protein